MTKITTEMAAHNSKGSSPANMPKTKPKLAQIIPRLKDVRELTDQ